MARKRSAPSDGKDARKASLACLTCRKKKVRCSGTTPCQYCSKRGLDCRVPEHGHKRMYMANRIEELESKLARYERDGYDGLPATLPPRASEPPVSGTAQIGQRRESILHPQSSHSSPQDPHHSRSRSSSFIRPSTSFSAPLTQPKYPSYDGTHTSPAATILAGSSLSSSHTFGSRVQDLLGSSRLELEQTAKPWISPEANQLNEIISHPWRLSSSDFPKLPPRHEAQRLLDTALFYIGQSQHHIDAREFSDKMWAFYQNRDDPAQLESLWVLEMILMIAIGTLFDANPEGNDEFSGVVLFEYAHRNVPTLSDLRFKGKIGIEIYALFAIYLGNMNRKEEAYLYISTAMRLAISQKYHRVCGTRHLMQSERVHNNRLWWTIYMQERRLAAATGNPPSIGDEAINIPLPTDSPGFPPVGPMCTNIKIARATGRILAVLYNPEDESEHTFIPHVQDIVKSLYEISQEIPSDSVTDVYNLGRDQSLRTTASLHLMLFQATILTIRPIMLHAAKLILSGHGPTGEQLHASPLGRLSRTCAEAARRQLKVVATLRKRNMIAIFGFYDFEASFSAAFIMILAAILDSVCEENMKINPKPGLPQALEELQHLADHGNTYARERLNEVKKLWKVMAQKIESLQGVNVSPQGINGDAQANRVSHPNGATPAGFGDSGIHQDMVPGTQGQTSPEDFMLLDTDLWDNFSNLWVPMPETNSQQEMMMADIPPDDFYKHCYSMYNNPDWDLTGEDVGDFAELGRHIQDS
ncbi:uncharacterized protein B0J16DRAFT_352636 [Fusarium flagelliforme]|uniref:Zn(2)-C6 fungal-type domain-containing protein n=1 Tax=Fusarium flagelliforme TaxID=2675880 RepID=A0A395N5D1_9HYPO|nr:uncharacterized protein B0J16DRAFT_352636 [Fusarium flagelliforme]KAH7197884.1 hypothetical protein B0J16DRAFT_352636 [Fusarium flagelliforme]RFN55334.1 hypothetical protein FIE12Z_370 [Fusarium flagelliforme]